MMKKEILALCGCAALASVTAASGAPTAKGKALPSRLMPSDACRDMRVVARERNGQTNAPRQPLTAEDRKQVDQLRAMTDGNGSAAPNAEAQAMLRMMATMTAGRGDRNSQIANEYFRSMGIKPSSDMDKDLAALGC